MAFRLWRCFLDWMFVRAGAKPPRSLEEEKNIVIALFILILYSINKYIVVLTTLAR